MSDAQAVVGRTEPAFGSIGPASFEQFPIRDEVRAAIASRGYQKPTDVQSAVIGVALEGRDIAVQARTGSGKTAAFGIPIAERVEPGSASAGLPHALVLTPTRELASQVAEELRILGSSRGVRVLPVYGGVPMWRQTAALKSGADVVVGTPGRLLDHIRRGNLSLGEIRVAVLDEADEMLSMGFWEDVTELLRMAPRSRQTMLFSATLPYQVAQAAAQYLRDPVRINVSGEDLKVDGIENCILHVAVEIPKPRQLLYLLEWERPESALIFCNTRNEAEMIAKYLTQAGFVSEALTGNFKQCERERVMQRIKSGELRYMVATDIAARGIDINDLSHVINYSLPEFSEVYLHRVGRTGRIGKAGAAVSLVDGKGLSTLGVLEREFGVKFIEKKQPTEEEVLRRRSERIMKELAEKASVAEVGQHLPVAQEILASADGAQVVAFLLKTYFNNQAQPADRRPAVQNRPTAHESHASEPEGEQGGRRRRRRRSRRHRRGDESSNESYADGGGPIESPVAEPAPGEALSAPLPEEVGSTEPMPPAETDGLTRLRVNIGFDDGFKGRGAVAKKISALAGLNDGIIMEVEARRSHAVLKASPDIAELVIERVDGAQLGKKTISVARAE